MRWLPQVAIVLFRTLEEFYDAPLKLTTLPLIIWRFGTIGIGSLLVGADLVAADCPCFMQSRPIKPTLRRGLCMQLSSMLVDHCHTC